MTKGKPWPNEDERLLRDLFSSGITDLDVLVAKFSEKYTREGVRQKLISFGMLKEQSRHCRKKEPFRTSKLEVPTDLPTIETTLKIIGAAMLKIVEGGLRKEEVQNLQILASLAKTYKETYAEYADYRGLEDRVIEAEAKYAELVKKTSKNETC